MIRSLANASSSRVEIQVAIITFGGDKASLHQDLTPASKATWTDMVADGKTPMGLAFLMAQELIEEMCVWRYICRSL